MYHCSVWTDCVLQFLTATQYLPVLTQNVLDLRLWKPGSYSNWSLHSITAVLFLQQYCWESFTSFIAMMA